MKTTALIYGTPDQNQQVIIDFECRPFRKFWGKRSTIFVNYCKVTEPLKFKPTDLDGDLSISIAEALGEHPKDIRFECNIKHSVKPVKVIQIVQSYETEMLFI